MEAKTIKLLISAGFKKSQRYYWVWIRPDAMIDPDGEGFRIIRPGKAREYVEGGEPGLRLWLAQYKKRKKVKQKG